MRPQMRIKDYFENLLNRIHLCAFAIIKFSSWKRVELRRSSSPTDEIRSCCVVAPYGKELKMMSH